MRSRAQAIGVAFTLTLGLFVIGCGPSPVEPISDAGRDAGPPPDRDAGGGELDSGPRPDGGGVPLDMVFASDFSTATGTGEDALLDLGKSVPWTGIAGNGRLNTVIASDGLDFPTPNVLQVVADWTGTDGRAAAQNMGLELEGSPIAVPGPGESLFFRVYERVVIPDDYTSDPSTHPIEDATSEQGYAGSKTNWMMRIETGPGPGDHTQWRIRWDVGQGGRTDWPNNLWSSPWLEKHTTYRVEWQIQNVDDATFRLHARIYDASGALLYDDDDFANVDESATLATAPAFAFNETGLVDVPGVRRLIGFQGGYNGLNSGVTRDMDLYYQGGFAVRTADWCGPYDPAEADF